MRKQLIYLQFSLILLSGFLTGCIDGSHDTNPEASPFLGVHVAVDAGLIQGQEHSQRAVWEWLAIPFAQPPSGDLRWKAPRPAVPWEGTRDTTSFGNVCPQKSIIDGTIIGDEDCLHLNVWRPRSQERELPVMLWIHGGANYTGAASEPAYNGARLAEQAGIVVVTMQYRLGPLGWLYYEPLRTGSANDNSGNFGTLDIMAGLQWLQDNIAAFGGNPEAVTVAGQSAGAANILSLLISSQASGLLQQAILQSPGGRVTAVTDIDDAAASATTLVDELLALEGYRAASMSDRELADFLRSKSAEEIIGNNPVTPTIYGDGHVLPVAGFDLFESGDFPNKVPLIIGINKDEFRHHTYTLGRYSMPDASDELREAVAVYISNLWRVDGCDSIATQLRNLDDYPDIYAYHFHWGSPDTEGNSPLPLNLGTTAGAFHGAEVPFMFGNWDTLLNERDRSIYYNKENADSRETMAAVMVDYWGAFVRQGNPNSGHYPPWSPWSNYDGAFKAIVLDVNYATGQPQIGEDYEAWTTDTVLANIRARVMEPLLSELMPYLESWL